MLSLLYTKMSFVSDMLNLLYITQALGVLLEKVSEYDQVIPQPHTTDKTPLPWKETHRIKSDIT